MNFDAWLAYSLAATVIIIIPGPTVLLVITQSLSHGKTAALPLVLGVMLGDSVALLMSLLGLGAILATSAALFTAIKWIGAGYLVYLGISLWRTSDQPPASTAPHRRNARALFGHAFVVTTFNPKGIVFFLAFLPQFVDTAGNLPLQFFILGTTFVVIGTLNAALYAIFSAQLNTVFERKQSRRWFHRCGGGALISAGILTAAMQRS